MKKNIFVTVYAVFVSLVFLGTVVFAGVSLYSKNNKGYLESKQTYDKMAAELKQAFENPSSPNMNEKINHAIGSYEKYSFISIKVNGNTIFLYPGDTEQPSENTKFSKLYFQSYRVGDLNLYVQANVYTLSPATIAYYAKVSFIVVLIFTLLTIVLIFVIANTEEDTEQETDETEDLSEEENEENTDSEMISETENSETEVNFVEETETSENKEPEFEAFPADEIAITPEEDISEDSSEENEANIEKDIEAESESQEPEKTETNEEPVEKAELPVEDYKPAESAPNGLYSPVTGFGWESYLKPRLENELSRASASEFDVVLFLIRITGFETLDEEKIQKICEYLTNMFQFKDLIFEYKNNCFAAIKTNTTIDEAIPMADQIYSELTETIEPEKCYIGISSKTIRMVGADRVLKEADAALEHSMEDKDNPITAFRADAEKYMDFIENN